MTSQSRTIHAQSGLPAIRGPRPVEDQSSNQSDPFLSLIAIGRGALAALGAGWGIGWWLTRRDFEF
jgi:hypothetical protein